MNAVWLLLPLYLIPIVSHNEVLLTILIFTYILAILAIGFNIVFGYAGQLTMFHGAAFGIGAYGTYLILTNFGVSFWLALLPMFAGILILSLLIGWICFKFRLREFYFAVVTLAFSELARLVVLNWNSVTNGTLGLLVLEKPSVWLPGTGVIKIDDTRAWYLLTLTSLCAVSALSQVLVRSWIGRNFAAIRLNEDLAQTLGINTFRYKLLAFTASNILAAFAGAFFGFYSNYIEPSQLSITQSLDVIAMVLVGGMGTILGPVVGAFLLTGLPHVIELSAEIRAAAYGAILIMAILIMPRGIVGLFSRRRHVS
jgi:branched-chain amino acid transport system permease protein